MITAPTDEPIVRPIDMVFPGAPDPPPDVAIRSSRCNRLVIDPPPM